MPRGSGAEPEARRSQARQCRSESRIDLLSRFFLHGRQDMGLGVKRDADGGVTEALGDDLGVDALTEEHCGVDMPWVEGDALSLSGSSANARQTNAVSLRSPRHTLPTLRPRPLRSGRHSAALRGTC